MGTPISIDASAGRWGAIGCLLRDYSLEMTAKDRTGLPAIAHFLLPGTPVSITFLPGEAMPARTLTAALLKCLGFNPIPHISARRLSSEEELHTFLQGLQRDAGIDRAFVVAGDLPTPSGPYEDALSLIRTGLLARYGVRRVGISGYPEGHPDIPDAILWQALREKYRMLLDFGHEPIVTTQFGFDADPVIAWIEDVRSAGIEATLRIGVPGPANAKTLLRFAARCGVGASTKVLRKYGLSVTKLLNTAGPDRLLTRMAERLGPEHGDVRIHFYPFGGMDQTARWARDFTSTLIQSPIGREEDADKRPHRAIEMKR